MKALLCIWLPLDTWMIKLDKNKTKTNTKKKNKTKQKVGLLTN